MKNHWGIPSLSKPPAQTTPEDLKARIERSGATSVAINWAAAENVTASNEVQASTEPTTPPKSETPWRLIPIKDIEVNEHDRLRPLNDKAVEEKMRSIKVVSLLHPITVTVSNVTEDGHATYLLRAGLHRLEACRRLEWQEIPATVSTLEGLHAKLAF